MDSEINQSRFTQSQRYVNFVIRGLSCLTAIADDILDGGRKASNRKWKQFKVALTSSQLLFFKDVYWDQNLMEHPESGNLMLPENAVKPDEVISVSDAIAVFDSSYTKVIKNMETHTSLITSF